jgi:CrcB protein
MSPILIASVVLAGSLGALLRYWSTRMVAADRFPTPVLLVNVAGSLLAGVLVGLSSAGVLQTEFLVILVTGFCGGLTTFSTLSVETIQLIRDGHPVVAAASITTNLVLGIGAATLGFLVAGLIA